MINILPKQQKKALLHEYRIRFISVAFLMISFLGFIATALMIPSYLYSKSKKVLIEKKIEDFNLANPEIAASNTNEIISDINLKLQTLNVMWSNSIYINKTIGDVFDLLPSGISATRFSYDEKTDGSIFFEIHGKAQNRVVLRDFKTIMEKNENFSNVDLPISNFVKKSDIDYIITFTLKSSVPPPASSNESNIKNDEEI